MSIIKTERGENGEVMAQLMNVNIGKDKQSGKDIVTDTPSSYAPSKEVTDMRNLVLKHFALGVVNMQKPRIEFNDLSVLLRDQTDQLSFNVYQANNGEAPEADITEAWRSRAIRPVVRNKAMSIAAHATARTIFPKVFAHNDESDEEADAARIMMDLIEWSAEQSNYEYYALQRVLMALWSPASIGMTEYAEVWRKVKTERNPDGTWKEEYMLDPDMSGFRDEAVPTDELFIENFFEPDVQKQAWLIRRKVISFDLAQAKYQHIPDFVHVQPGMQILYNDANQCWYQVYDTNMRQYDVEEVTYWNKGLDVKICLVNGVMMTPSDNPNPRNDKRYPFDKFGWSLINTRCFYYKSLAFYLQSDADIVNTLYPMIIDKTYLDVIKPMVNSGGQVIKSNVVVPGAVTTLQDPNATLKPIDETRSNVLDGMKVLEKVETSLTESAADNQQPGQADQGDMTAYQVSKIEQNAQVVLGLFVKMIAQHVREFGKLRINDILQFLTLPEVNAIEDDAPLVYKTFLIPDKTGNSQGKTRKIKFDLSLPSEKITKEEYLKMSYDVLEREDGGNQELHLVNPELFRKWKYQLVISPDVMNPMSEELESAYGLEEYDRMVQHPEMYDPEETALLLLSLYKKTRRDPTKYTAKKGQGMNVPQLPGINTAMNPQQPNGGPANPSANAMKPKPSPLSTPTPVAPNMPVR